MFVTSDSALPSNRVVGLTLSRPPTTRVYWEVMRAVVAIEDQQRPLSRSRSRRSARSVAPIPLFTVILPHCQTHVRESIGGLLDVF